MLFFQTQSGDLGGAGMVPFSRRWDGYWGYFPFQLTTGWWFGTMEFYDFPIMLGYHGISWFQGALVVSCLSHHISHPGW